MADNPSPADAEAAVRYRMSLEGDLGLWLQEHLWNHFGPPLILAGNKFRIVYDEEVPDAFRRDDMTILVREKDGKLFEIDIDVTSREVSRG